jgi:Mn-dependent DtxR family transcriptional regulator
MRGCGVLNNKGFYTVRGYEILDKKRKDVLSHSMEDYMEMIYRNAIKKGYIRINTLAELLNIKAPSATKMVQKLGQLGLVQYEKYGIVKLTAEGEKVGKALLERHNIIEEFLKNLGVEENLLMNVEMIEHNVTANALRKIELLNLFFLEYPDVLVKLQEYRRSCL